MFLEHLFEVFPTIPESSKLVQSFKSYAILKNNTIWPHFKTFFAHCYTIYRKNIKERMQFDFIDPFHWKLYLFVSLWLTIGLTGWNYSGFVGVRLFPTDFCLRELSNIVHPKDSMASAWHKSLIRDFATKVILDVPFFNFFQNAVWKTVRFESYMI